MRDTPSALRRHIGVVVAAVSIAATVVAWATLTPPSTPVPEPATAPQPTSAPATVPAAAPAAPSGPDVDCAPGGSVDWECLETSLAAITTVDGPAAALDAWEQVEGEHPELFGQCHTSYHVVGQTAGAVAAREGTDLSSVMAAAKPACNFGYVHGVMEGYLADVATADLPGIIPGLCDQLDTMATGVHGNCGHGIGHDAMSRFDGDVSAGFELCRTITGEGLAVSCADGIYMAYAERVAEAARSAAPAPPYDQASTRLLCADAGEDFSGTCNLYAGVTWMPYFGDDTAGMLAQCNDVAGAWIGDCSDGIGRAAAFRSGLDAATSVAACQDGPTALNRSRCIRGVATSIALARGTGQARGDDDVCALVPAEQLEDCEIGMSEGGEHAASSSTPDAP